MTDQKVFIAVPAEIARNHLTADVTRPFLPAHPFNIIGLWRQAWTGLHSDRTVTGSRGPDNNAILEAIMW
jgi:hypothetical protein